MTMRNRDVKPAGTYDHPTQFAAKTNTEDRVTLDQFTVGQMVNLDVNGNRVHGDVQRVDADGTHTVRVLAADGRYSTVTATADELTESPRYANDENVWVNDDITYRGWIVTESTPGWYLVQLEHPDTWRRSARTVHLSQLSRMTTADLARDCPDTFFPGNHPDLPGHNWGITYSGQFGSFNISHGYRGITWEIPADTVGWGAVTTDGAAADLIWSNRDVITAALHDQGFGGQRVYVAIAVEEDASAVAVYRDDTDEMTPILIQLTR